MLNNLSPVGLLVFLGGSALLICAAITLAVYAPTLQRRRRLRRAIAAKKTARAAAVPDTEKPLANQDGGTSE